jgi:hypothetical protein
MEAYIAVLLAFLAFVYLRSLVMRECADNRKKLQACLDTLQTHGLLLQEIRSRHSAPPSCSSEDLEEEEDERMTDFAARIRASLKGSVAPPRGR